MLIGLSAPTELLHTRIRRRGRRMETAVTAAHLDTLAAAFAAYTVWDRQLIRLDAAHFNTFNRTHLVELAAALRQLPTLQETR